VPDVFVPRVGDVERSNPGQAKSHTALQMVRHRFNMYVSSCVTGMDTAHSLHVSA